MKFIKRLHLKCSYQKPKPYILHTHTHTHIYYHHIMHSKYIRTNFVYQLCHSKASLMAQWVKNLPAMEEAKETWVQSHGSGRSPGEGSRNPLQYSGLENHRDRGDWLATVHEVEKSWTRQISQHTGWKRSYKHCYNLFP